MKQFSILILTILVLASCGRVVRDKMYVEKVQDSEDSDYLYRVTIDSDMEDGIAYYTNHKYEVGDTLASLGEFKSIHSYMIDSLRAQNDNLKKENDDLRLFNGLLMKVLKDSIKK